MFGKNRIRKPTKDPANLAVQEIFYTIQGEGPFAGCPAVFIRLAGCHLQCQFCDTEFESGIDNMMTVPEILAAVDASAEACGIPRRGKQLVVLTGGEPMRQDLSHLVPALLKHQVRTIQIETAGTFWQDALAEELRRFRLVLVCSPKTPRVHPTIRQFCHDWKYIIQAGRCDREDGLPAMGMQKNNLTMAQRIYRPWDETNLDFYSEEHTIWVSPCDDHDAAKNAQNREEAARVAMRHGYRLTLQQHKLLGLP
jgi:organic radical activating enzyme